MNHLEARQLFAATGVSVTDWARRRGFKRASVYSVLAGRVNARRGHAHRVAVALGLKALPGQSPHNLENELVAIARSEGGGLTEGTN